MYLKDLIESYRKKLNDNSNYYSCLLFALQIPSICSRIEFPKTDENKGGLKEGKFYGPKGRVWDGNMYKAWLKKHSNSFVNIYSDSMEIEEFCKKLYDLRCQMTHEGVVMTGTNRFFFIEANSSAMCVNDIVFLPVKRLCDDMFEAAENTLFNSHKDINITQFQDMVLPPEIYNSIMNDVETTYNTFWKNYSDSDNMLNCIYDHIIVSRDDKKDIKQEMDNFFRKKPDDIFEIWDFSINFGGIVDDKETFIHKEFNKSKSKVCLITNKPTDVLRLSKTEYERMLQVTQDLSKYSEENKFDINKYIRCMDV